MNNTLLLLRTLLKSTSSLNTYKYSKDKKKKNRAIVNTIGFSVLFLFMMAYSFLLCIGYGFIGLADKIPITCATTISAIAFFFTLFKTNGYLFNFKEYDMLMSLPFEAKTVAGAKFIYMYIKSLPWYLSISLAMVAGYGIFVKPAIYVYPLWLVLSMIVPVVPMLGASFVGFLIAKIGAGFKKKSIVQTVLVFLFLILCFASRFILEKIFENGKVDETLKNISESMDKTASLYPPAGWFSGAITNLRISDMLLLISITILLFELVFIPVGRAYRKINSNFKNHASIHKFKMNKQNKKSILNAIAYKEFKRMTSSVVYLTNVGFGELMVLIVGIVALFIDFESMIHVVLKGAPITKEMLYPAIPFLVYFFIGMVATTAITPSLEGKNYWIVQSLPISKKELYQGKMLFNMYLTVPFTVFSTICLCISSKMPILTSILSVVLGVSLCAFSSAWGCVCGIKHMRLDWENEIEVIKQGSAVAVYLLPNLFVNMGLIVLVIILGTKINQDLIMFVMVCLVSLLAGLSYRKSIKIGDK